MYVLLKRISFVSTKALTFNTYFSLAGDANIDHDHDDDDAQQARHRHQKINSYFSDEEDDQSSPSGGEEVDGETRDYEELGSNEDYHNIIIIYIILYYVFII
jgi:hypothetical protein